MKYQAAFVLFMALIASTSAIEKLLSRLRSRGSGDPGSMRNGETIQGKDGNMGMSYDSFPDLSNSLNGYMSNSLGQTRNLFGAIIEDISKSPSRMANSGLSTEVRRSVEILNNRLRELLKIILDAVKGNSSLREMIIRERDALRNIITDLFTSIVNIIRAGVNIGHIMPETYKVLGNYLQYVAKDVSNIFMNPAQFVKSFDNMRGDLNSNLNGVLGGLGGGLSEMVGRLTRSGGANLMGPGPDYDSNRRGGYGPNGRASYGLGPGYGANGRGSYGLGPGYGLSGVPREEIVY